jgi:hypothetical protein
MISLGVDYYIHAGARYQEERRQIAEPRLAMRAGFAGVLGALTLAMLTDGIAFFSNLTSGIETVIGFGIGAGIAVLSAYIILGMSLPLITMRLDQRRLRLIAAGGLATTRRDVTTGSSPQVPSTLLDESANHTDGAQGGTPYEGEVMEDSSLWQIGEGVHFPAKELLGKTPWPRLGFAEIVVGLARLPWVVIPITITFTLITTYLASQLEPKLDVREFFDSNSDFVVGLDKVDQYTSPALAGEPATIYIEGNLTAPESLYAIRDLLNRLKGNDRVTHRDDGEIALYGRTVLQLLSRIASSEYARGQVQSFMGVAITDADSDGLPDTAAQVDAAYRYMVQHGVPLDPSAASGQGGTLIYDAAQVRETLFYDLSGQHQPATTIAFGVLGTREQANVGIAREALERDMEPLPEVPSISFVGLTGSPFTRDVTLSATTRNLKYLFAGHHGSLFGAASPLDAIVTLRPGNRDPYRVGSFLALCLHVSGWLSPELRYRHHWGCIHRSGD